MAEWIYKLFLKMMSDAEIIWKPIKSICNRKTLDFTVLSCEGLIFLFTGAAWYFASWLLLSEIFLIYKVHTEFSVFLMSIGILFLFFSLYLYKKNRFTRGLLIMACIIAFCKNFVLIMACVILDMAVDEGAKKIENIICFLVLWFLDCGIAAYISKYTYRLMHYFTACFTDILNSAFNCVADMVPISLFLLVSLIVIEMAVIYEILLLFVFYCFRSKKEWNNKKGFFENYFCDRDSKYLKCAMKKAGLLLFILLYVFAIFHALPEYIFTSFGQSNVINTLTVFTLIMLYIDKRVQWRKEIKAIEGVSD